MKRIGSGLQYVVYDIGKGRVRKISKSKLQQFLTLISWGYVNPLSAINKVRSINKMSAESVAKIKSLDGVIDSNVIGNPVYISKFGYEQDKGIQVGAYIEKCEVEEAKRVVYGYVQNVIDTWKFGFAEMTCNFHVNYALNKDGEVFLADLGELLVSKEVILQRIEDKRWQKCWSYRDFLKDKPELKEYFGLKMEEIMKKEVFEKYWMSEV